MYDGGYLDAVAYAFLRRIVDNGKSLFYLNALNHLVLGS